MLPDDSFIVKLLCIYRFYPDSIEQSVGVKNIAPKLGPFVPNNRV
jgi:hypothetical protein